MVGTQEIVERTFYICLLHTLLERRLTINPDDYLPLSQANEKRYLADKEALPKFIYLFGVGNNQVRGPKEVPRITIECEAYYPGDIGVDKYIIGDKLESGMYQASEFPYETRDISLDIHLVSNTQPDMRLLHEILFESLPTRGYVRPYFNDLEDWAGGRVQPTGNLFIEIGNFYDHPDDSHGLLEKVYTYTVKDGIIPEKVLEDGEITPIKDISVLIGTYEDQEKDMLDIHVT